MTTTRELARELADCYDITTEVAREGVDIYLGQIIDIDGEAATVLDRANVINGSGRIVGEDLTLTDDAAEAIRESFAAYYAN